MAGYGGPTPKDFGLRMTVEAPTGTDESTPVNIGDIFKLGGTETVGSTGYKAAACVAGDDNATVVLLQATERKTAVGPMGVRVLAPYSQIQRLPYLTGSAPTIGQSIETATGSVREIVGKAFAMGQGYVLKVDTATEMAEVLI